MSVKIYLHPDMACLAGNREIVQTNGTTVGECLRDLIDRYPEMEELILDEHGKLKTFIEIYVNRTTVYPNQLEKTVSDGDEIHLTITIAGG